MRLVLPTHSKIYRVMNVFRTSPYVVQPPYIQACEESILPPVNDEYPDEFEVQEILAHRKLINRYVFLVHWKGYPSHDRS